LARKPTRDTFLTGCAPTASGATRRARASVVVVNVMTASATSKIGVARLYARAFELVNGAGWLVP
jgi:hypothetical protein